jgi:ribosome-binding ATPase
MSLSVGIVGLPNAGKSTLFKALTNNQVEIAPYPFTTISPNIGKVFVPDKRLNEIAKIVSPKKITPASIEFVDIAGLVKKAHQGEGLGNQFLAQIRECQIILEIIRGFKADNVEHVEKNLDPKRDIEIIKTELILKDIETIESALEKIERQAKTGNKEVIKKLEILRKIEKHLSQEKKISELEIKEEEKELIKEYQFLTQKPIIHVINTSEENDINIVPAKIDIQMQKELSELSESEIKEMGIEFCLDYLIQTCYNVLGLITFYTIKGGEEIRAWPIKKESKITEAAEKVHSDFKDKFIKSEVVQWKNLAKNNSWAKTKEKGEIKTVGKDYIVKDGDVIEFKI